MRKSFFLVIALVLIVSGAAYAAEITANLKVTIPAYIYLSFSDAVAEQTGTATASDIEWTVPAGGPSTGTYAESGQYILEVLSTAPWDLSINGPTVLTDKSTSETTDLYWKYGEPFPSDVSAFTGLTEASKPATGSTVYTRLMSFAVPYTWDNIPGTYEGQITIAATIH